MHVQLEEISVLGSLFDSKSATHGRGWEKMDEKGMASVESIQRRPEELRKDERGQR